MTIISALCIPEYLSSIVAQYAMYTEIEKFICVLQDVELRGSDCITIPLSRDHFQNDLIFHWIGNDLSFEQKKYRFTMISDSKYVSKIGEHGVCPMIDCTCAGKIKHIGFYNCLPFECVLPWCKRIFCIFMIADKRKEKSCGMYIASKWRNLWRDIKDFLEIVHS